MSRSSFLHWSKSKFCGSVRRCLCSLIGTEKDDVSSLLSLKLCNLLCHLMVLSYYLLKVVVFLCFLCLSNMPTLIWTGTVEDTY